MVDAQLRSAEQERKSRKDAVDAAIESEHLKLEKQELSVEAQKEGIKVAMDKKGMEDKLSLELMKLIESNNKGQ